MPIQPAPRRSGPWASVGRTAGAKMVVMVVAGVFGLINTRLILSHFGADAYAQYGLLATFPTLLPFTDLGIGAVILNVVAGSTDPAHDSALRRTLTTAIRVLLVSTVVICTGGIVIQLLGAWPTLLGARLMDGGGATATICLLIYALALPLSVGQRIVVGLGRSATQVISSGVVSPAMTTLLMLAIVTRMDSGNAVSIYSYLANTLVSIICIIVAWRATGPLLRQAARDVPRLREVPGVKVINTAGPQLLQSLVLPIAFQTDRILLSHLGASDALAQYNLANTLFNLLTQTVVAAGVAMWPVFARARSAGRIASPLKPSGVFACVAGVMSLVMALLAPWAADILSDGAIHLPTLLIVAFAVSVVVEAGKYPLGMYMTDPRGLRFQVAPVLVLVPANFALSWVLIAPFGAAGPVLGSVISVFICQSIPYLWWVRRDLARRRRAGEEGGTPADDARPTTA
ncbi:MATE family efflux transporter [Actinomyces marmotae]|uniref:MATE family efflux transporter n=2 Tax=Actinomyces marmotae TaxID=2737173 RepID=A0A6M8B6Q0_9ACTO|nr:MATE family efflux transporter [Actinomyces marmotae]